MCLGKEQNDGLQSCVDHLRAIFKYVRTLTSVSDREFDTFRLSGNKRQDRNFSYIEISQQRTKESLLSVS
jgi:hypothetical protein